MGDKWRVGSRCVTFRRGCIPKYGEKYVIGQLAFLSVPGIVVRPVFQLVVGESGPAPELWITESKLVNSLKLCQRTKNKSVIWFWFIFCLFSRSASLLLGCFYFLAFLANPRTNSFCWQLTSLNNPRRSLNQISHTCLHIASQNQPVYIY